MTADLPELAVGDTATVVMDERRILLCRSERGLHAVNAICPHQAKRLDGGRVRGQSIMCPYHGARFDLLTGASLSPRMTSRALKIYRCNEQDGMVRIAID